MASAKLTAYVSMNSAGFSKGLKSVSSEVGALSKLGVAAFAAMGTAAAAASAVVTAMVLSTAKAGDEIQKMSLRTEFSTQSLSELKHVAKLSDATLDDLGKSIKKMNSFIEDGKDGLSTSVREFEKLNLTVKDFAHLSPEEKFMKFHSALAKVTDIQAKTAIGSKIFGRGFQQMLPLFKLSSKELKNLRGETLDLGTSFNEVGANQAAEFSDNLYRLKESLGGGKKIIGESFLNYFNEIIKEVQPILAGMTQDGSLQDWAETSIDWIGRLMLQFLDLKESMSGAAYIAKDLAIATAYTLNPTYSREEATKDFAYNDRQYAETTQKNAESRTAIENAMAKIHAGVDRANWANTLGRAFEKIKAEKELNFKEIEALNRLDKSKNRKKNNDWKTAQEVAEIYPMIAGQSLKTQLNGKFSNFSKAGITDADILQIFTDKANKQKADKEAKRAMELQKKELEETTKANEFLKRMAENSEIFL